MRKLLWLAPVTLLACGGPSKPKSNPESEAAAAPSDLLTRAPEGQRAIVTYGGVPYLFHALVDGYSEDPAGAPQCWLDQTGEDGCPATVPAPAEVAAPYADAAAHLSVLGVEGPCTPDAGEVVLVNTSGCDVTWMIATPLTGCGSALAPVGRVDNRFDPELRWIPRPDVTGAPLFDAPAPADPVHRDLVATWLADPELRDGAPHEGKTARVSVDAGAEALETFAAAFAVGDGDDDCSWNYGERTAVGLRRGDTLTPLDIPSEWDGAFAWHDRIVGVAISDLRMVDVRAIGPDGVTPVFEERVWDDNEECTQEAWFGIGYPCGP